MVRKSWVVSLVNRFLGEEYSLVITDREVMEGRNAFARVFRGLEDHMEYITQYLQRFTEHI